jgi:hypothetical protein
MHFGAPSGAYRGHESGCGKRPPRTVPAPLHLDNGKKAPSQYSLRRIGPGWRRRSAESKHTGVDVVALSHKS